MGTFSLRDSVLKCRRFLSFFQRYIVRDISLAHWNLIRHFEKHELFGCDALVYERKFKSEYLERQIYERSLKSEPSIVKFIENQSEHLWKLTLYHLKKLATRRSRPSSETQGQLVGSIKCSWRKFTIETNFRHEHFIDPTNCPWVSEDDLDVLVNWAEFHCYF